MKTLFLFLLSALTLHAQSVAVKFYGTNNAAGLPPFWPQVVQPGTNAPNGFVLLTQAQLNNIVATNQPAYTAWESNKSYVAKAKLDANITRLLQLYDGIATARTTLRGFADATNTLSTAQLTTAVRQMADYQEKIMEFLQRLGPVLKSIYKPEEDSVQ